MEITKAEIRKMVQDELKSYVNAELDKKIAELLKKTSSKSHGAANDISKEALDSLSRFMYIKRNIWKKEI